MAVLGNFIENYGRIVEFRARFATNQISSQGERKKLGTFVAVFVEAFVAGCTVAERRLRQRCAWKVQKRTSHLFQCFVIRFSFDHHGSSETITLKPDAWIDGRAARRPCATGYVWS